MSFQQSPYRGFTMLARSLLLNVTGSLQFISQSRLKPIAQYRVTVLAVPESPEQVLEYREGLGRHHLCNEADVRHSRPIAMAQPAVRGVLAAPNARR